MTGVALKAWRQKVGLTQRQLAEMLEVPALTISAWETQRLSIKRPKMLALALWALAAATPARAITAIGHADTAPSRRRDVP
jgi:DNA-binding transcriptional regulator YiaG